MGVVGALLTIWVGFLGLRSRQKRPDAPVARKRHRRFSTWAWIAVLVAAVQQVHSVRMQVRAASANQNLEKRCAMNSTICKRHNWVAQLFRTEMARLKFVCVAVQHLQISLKRLAQMPQR